MTIRLAVLLSGSGTTLQNIIERRDAGELDIEICCVIGSRADAYGLERARSCTIPAVALPYRDYAEHGQYNEAVWQEIRKHDVDLVVLAGYMFFLDVPSDFVNRIMNVHPALIPAFCGHKMYGHHVHEAVLSYGAKVTGATVHFVDDQYDNGPIILQEAIPVLADDTPDRLAERVQELERTLYPRAIQLFAEGRISVAGRKVTVS
ncbi:MAG: phosphoribosylglycinamide formyltransferase [Candidatus Hydrogenedentes bacterium]|nr:phosphoribosylglycinamide formyltransferase [Candidatus Hydrogenedentota bacterium]